MKDLESYQNNVEELKTQIENFNSNCSYNGYNKLCDVGNYNSNYNDNYNANNNISSKASYDINNK